MLFFQELLNTEESDHTELRRLSRFYSFWFRTLRKGSIVTADPDNATRLSLLLRVRDLSDRTAWQDFVECYAPKVYSWCLSFGLQDSDAADATQEVLMKLVNGLRSFDYNSDRGRFRGWLKTVTRHVSIDMMRTWKERGSGDTQIQMKLETTEHPDAADLLYQEVEAAYQEELIRRASLLVQVRVQPKTWQAFQMTADQNLSAADVAKTLGMPVSEVYVAKSRVLKMLKEEVAKLESDAVPAS